MAALEGFDFLDEVFSFEFFFLRTPASSPSLYVSSSCKKRNSNSLCLSMVPIVYTCVHETSETSIFLLYFISF